MRHLKLLNKNFFYLFLFSILFITNSNSNEPIDIWDLEKIKKKDDVELESNVKTFDTETISNNNLNESNLIYIEEEEKIESNELKLVGLYDPAENDLNLNMWELSDGEKIIKLVEIVKMTGFFDSK